MAKLTEKEKEQILNRILEKISGIIDRIAEKPEIETVKIDYAGTFWGYYLRGYDKRGSEKFVERIEIDEQLWENKEEVEETVCDAIREGLEEEGFVWDSEKECFVKV